MVKRRICRLTIPHCLRGQCCPKLFGIVKEMKADLFPSRMNPVPDTISENSSLLIALVEQCSRAGFTWVHVNSKSCVLKCHIYADSDIREGRFCPLISPIPNLVGKHGFFYGVHYKIMKKHTGAEMHVRSY